LTIVANPARTRRKKGYTLKDVFAFAWNYWTKQPKLFAVTIAVLTVATIIETNMPNALSGFFEAIRLRKEASTVWWHLAAFLATYFGYLLTYNFVWRLYNLFENNNFNAVYNDAFTHIETLSEQYFVNTFTGSMITTIKRGRDRLETFEDQVLVNLYPTILTVFCTIIFLGMRMPVLAALLAVYVVIMLLLSAILVMKYAGPAQEAYANAQDEFGAHLADSIGGIITTKSYAQERLEVARFKKQSAELRTHNLKAYWRANTTSLIQRCFLGGMLTMLLGGGTWLFLHGQATIDDMAYLVLAHTILQSYIRNVGDHVKNLMTSSYDLHAIIALMEEQPSVKDKPNAKELHVQKGEVCFHDVSFTYPSKHKPVFANLSINIRPGERLALVGDSGGGKSTFVRLVQRLYEVSEGFITIDGTRIDEITQESLRSSVAVVPQDPILFHRSIRENIAYGRQDANFDEICKAAEQANIHDFIMSLPIGYDTLVGERGIKLSGGERQRIAIARAILSDRKILILDEATSSLDSISELAVQKAIRTVTHGRTSIMIAHRLSTIKDADRILVFHNGQIIEEGTHNDLIAKSNGIYASFFEIQSGGFLQPVD
jgi:ATP-binding cassette subfamily B protein